MLTLIPGPRLPQCFHYEREALLVDVAIYRSNNPVIVSRCAVDGATLQ